MEDVAAALLDLAPLPETGTMVDVGCGSGHTLVWFGRRRPGWRVLGLDVAAGALARARAGGPPVVGACALALPLDAGSVDLVVAEDLLQHLPAGADGRALAEMARVLRPGGCLYLRTNAPAVPVLEGRAAGIRRYRARDLAARLAGAGFAVLRLGRLNALPGLAEIPRARCGRVGPGVCRGRSAGLRWYAPAVGCWLRLEGRAVRWGWSWPLGRTTVALCRRAP
jgi:SAM-dependent methyltransferase